MGKVVLVLLLLGAVCASPRPHHVKRDSQKSHADVHAHKHDGKAAHETQAMHAKKIHKTNRHDLEETFADRTGIPTSSTTGVLSGAGAWGSARYGTTWENENRAVQAAGIGAAVGAAAGFLSQRRGEATAASLQPLFDHYDAYHSISYEQFVSRMGGEREELLPKDISVTFNVPEAQAVKVLEGVLLSQEGLVKVATHDLFDYMAVPGDDETSGSLDDDHLAESMYSNEDDASAIRSAQDFITGKMYAVLETSSLNSAASLKELRLINKNEFIGALGGVGGRTITPQNSATKLGELLGFGNTQAFRIAFDQASLDSADGAVTASRLWTWLAGDGAARVLVNPGDGIVIRWDDLAEYQRDPNPATWRQVGNQISRQKTRLDLK